MLDPDIALYVSCYRPFKLLTVTFLPPEYEVNMILVAKYVIDCMVFLMTLIFQEEFSSNIRNLLMNIYP